MVLPLDDKCEGNGDYREVKTEASVESPQASAEVDTPATGKPALRETPRRRDVDPDDGPSSLTGRGAGDAGWRHGRLRQRGSPPAPMPNVPPIRLEGSARARTALAGFDDWRRLARDLHDGVQNELVALIVKLALAEQDPELTASLDPTLVAATTVMLLLDKPVRLMLGYLLGAYITSITLGLVIVFSLSNSSATNTTENTISPAVDLGLGAVFLMISIVLYTGRHERLRERRAAKKAAKPDKGPPRWQ